MQLDGSQRAGGHDETIYQCQRLSLSSPEHSPNGHHHLETAEVSDSIFRCERSILLVEMCQSTLQHIVLMTNALGIYARTRSHTLVEGNMAEEVHPDAGWRRVGNAHLSYAQHAAPLIDARVGKFCTDLDGLFILLLRHGGLVQEIPRTSGYLAVDDTIYLREIVIHPHVHNAQLESMLTAEHVHTATAAREVDHLLPSDLTRRNAHALALNAVVAA